MVAGAVPGPAQRSRKTRSGAAASDKYEAKYPRAHSPKPQHLNKEV